MQNDGGEIAAQVKLADITMENFEQCIGLQVDKSQYGFVASNSYSLSEAYADKVSQPYAIYAGEDMVGFVMYDYEPVRRIAYVTRLMIDKRYQRRGYGRKAMELLLAQIRRIEGCRFIQISYNRGNINAAALYESLGFAATGEYADDGETICRICL